MELSERKEMKVKFARGHHDGTSKNGIFILDDKSPIGEAIIGKYVGDTVEVANIEKYYKILGVEE